MQRLILLFILFYQANDAQLSTMVAEQVHTYFPLHIKWLENLLYIPLCRILLWFLFFPSAFCIWWTGAPFCYTFGMFNIFLKNYLLVTYFTYFDACTSFFFSGWTSTSWSWITFLISEDYQPTPRELPFN